MQNRHPDATLLEPWAEPVAPAGPLATEDEQAIRQWLDSIGENDAQVIAEVIGYCREDADYRDYYLGRARIELPEVVDDRIHCTTCINLTGELCQAARRGELAQTSRNHRPIDRPRRCYCYSPRPDVADRRTGAERYPGMEWMRAKA